MSAYGKTEPIVYLCTECNTQTYNFRRGKAMQKEVINKYCPTERKRTDHKPKISKHSSN